MAKDVAQALGYTDTDQAIRNHCNYAELFKPVEVTGLEIGPRGMYFIPEADVRSYLHIPAGSHRHTATRP